jgi:uncharacterized protein YecE (DUF72 family)
MTGTFKSFIGTSGWTIPKEFSQLFPQEGSHLERYSSVFNAVEVTSSFYQDHQFSTYCRWRETVPADFGFSVKLNKHFTHECKLKVKRVQLEKSLATFAGLEEKWRVLLVQLPPKLEMSLKTAEKFFITLRSLYGGSIVLEARNCTWAQNSALPLYEDLGISLAHADPERCLASAESRIAGDLVYFRYHGSPEIYRSSYSEGVLAGLARSLNVYHIEKTESWCVFDNTTFGHATINALDLSRLVREADSLHKVS